MLELVTLLWKLLCLILAHTAAISFLAEIALMVLGWKQAFFTFNGIVRKRTYAMATSLFTGLLIKCVWRILTWTLRLTLTFTRPLCCRLLRFFNFISSNFGITNHYLLNVSLKEEPLYFLSFSFIYFFESLSFLVASFPCLYDFIKMKTYIHFFQNHTQWSTVNSLLTDISIRRTPGDGPCRCSVILL